ncbi:Fructose-1,6-bisphosphatase [Boothiomyces macroporosus]|uniref:fructose-bisphosphatase n=1 Tax=Boothiomyces macroporosus TaxID=261099 RepID=A0AAD5Y1E8_9FUNG|nr:Fructose-1,6-bisphosphatase [Boothiomyces macroporosus]
MGEGDLKTDIITLTNHILSFQKQHPEATGDLSVLLSSVATACKWITNVVRKAELLHVLGQTGTTNVQAENVQKLDILSNEIMVNMLIGSKKTAMLISEEVEEAISVPKEKSGHYCVVFDPLDGSSNIDCGVSVGTIFGIYRLDVLTDKPLTEQVLVPGSKMVCGGYCMYGSSSVLVMSFGGEANGYTLDPNLGEFLLTHPKMKLGKKKIYSLNEGYAHSFHPAVKGYLDTLKFPPEGFQGKFTPYSARYVGSMLYECFPMAMLVEACGGKASNGKQRILDLTPKSIHDRSPIFLGTAEEVDAIEQWFKKHP